MIKKSDRLVVIYDDLENERHLNKLIDSVETDLGFRGGE